MRYADHPVADPILQDRAPWDEFEFAGLLGEREASADQVDAAGQSALDRLSVACLDKRLAQFLGEPGAGVGQFLRWRRRIAWARSRTCPPSASASC
jgi:hypothetical protein